MTIGRSQIPEQIDAFEEGGAAKILQDRIDALRGIDRSPASAEDIQKRAAELNKLFPAQRRASIYDLATDISRGIAMSAQSGRPTPLGYALGAGFNLFAERQEKLREQREKLDRELLLIAKQEEDKKREEEAKIEELGLEQIFELSLKQVEKDGKYKPLFEGKSDFASAMNYLTAAYHDPSLRIDPDTGEVKPEYIVAEEFINRKKTRFITTDEGTKVIEEPGYDFNALMKRTKPKTEQKSTFPAPEKPGYTFIKKNPNTGGLIYQNNANQQYEEFNE